jgi:DNA-binding cell septation regulator SpoVG
MQVGELGTIKHLKSFDIDRAFDRVEDGAPGLALSGPERRNALAVHHEAFHPVGHPDRCALADHIRMPRL